MATEQVQVSALISASPNRVFAAWMDERQHSAFTGGRATVQPWVGGRLTAWDGYIEGAVVELDTGRRIVMTWRTVEFPEDADDSRVEVRFDAVAGGTNVVIEHTKIPLGQAEKYKQGWRSNYLDPMKKFFSKPGAMKAAIQAAAEAGRLPAPVFTGVRQSFGMLRRPVRPAVPPVQAEARNEIESDDDEDKVSKSSLPPSRGQRIKNKTLTKAKRAIAHASSEAAAVVKEKLVKAAVTLVNAKTKASSEKPPRESARPSTSSEPPSKPVSNRPPSRSSSRAPTRAATKANPAARTPRTTSRHTPARKSAATKKPSVPPSKRPPAKSSRPPAAKKTSRPPAPVRSSRPPSATKSTRPTPTKKSTRPGSGKKKASRR